MVDVLQTLGKYEIRGTLGSGAMGVVYDGWDPLIARRVAIKAVRLPSHPDAETEDEIARFRREAQAAGRLTHPNIVAVYDYGETTELAYIVMEYIDGPTLKSLLDRQERFNLGDIRRVMADVLTGLQFSHERGVVHRDIKPANVMLTSDGRAKLADFGIARIESSSMTQAGAVMGTPAYMSPEQFMGQVVDPRTDIYSAGVLLYQLLTGERPFDGSLTAIMHKVLNTEPPVPSQLAVTSPEVLDAVVRRAMAKRPVDRFTGAKDFLTSLNQALDTPALPPADVEATMVSSPSARRSPAATPMVASRGRPVPLIGGAVATAILLIAAGGWWLAGPKPSAPPTPSKTVVAESIPQPPPAAPAHNEGVRRPAEQSAPPIPAGAPAAVIAAPLTQSSKPEPAPQPEPKQAAPAPVLPPPATQPSAAPPAPAVPEKLAAVSLGSIRVQIQAALARTTCALASGTVQDSGTVLVSGLVGASAEQGLRSEIAGLAGLNGLNWQVKSVDPAFCETLSVLRPISSAGGAPEDGLRLALAGNRTTLRDGEKILPLVTMASFPGHLRVDYVAHDGSIAHLFPTAADPAQHFVAVPDRVLSAGSVLDLGVGGGRPVWEIGPPYGTDMIIAIASTAPLMTEAPAQNAEERSDDYFRRLRAAVEAARRSGAHITGTYLLVDTLPK